MFTFTLEKLSKMGQHDETYGTSYWGNAKEELKPLKFNSQNQNITAGMVITCEETINKRSIKNVDYLQLKKVQVIGSNPVQQPQNAPQHVSQPQMPTNNAQLDRIEAKIDMLLGNDADLDVPEPSEDELKQYEPASGYDKFKQSITNKELPIDDTYGDDTGY